MFLHEHCCTLRPEANTGIKKYCNATTLCSTVSLTNQSSVKTLIKPIRLALLIWLNTKGVTH